MQDFILYEDAFKKIDAELRRLYELANAKLVFLVDKNGQLISAVGDTATVDTTALASLTAGNIAASGGIAKLLGQKEFSILFHEGERDNLHISIVAGKVILVVVFDQRTSLGLVRLRAKKATEALEIIFQQMQSRTGSVQQPGEEKASSPFADITDEDIEKLFG